MNRIPLILVLLTPFSAFAEPEATELIAGDVLSHFREVAKWGCVGRVEAVPGQTRFELAGEGTILTNVPSPKSKRAPYLFTKEEFRDVEVRLEFMVPKGSNSGIYLMGRYEIQILDSFGNDNPTFSDLGGLYQRWDTKRPKKQFGYEGVAPRVNAAKAPGEWQTLDIVFRAPRFDGSGAKTENARFVKVEVNGVVVHENQEVTGPTRANPLNGEVAKGPVAIQGDHGPIAIRSFKVKPVTLDQPTNKPS